jgi:hypothetical protein
VVEEPTIEPNEETVKSNEEEETEPVIIVPLKSGRWTDAEHQSFLEALLIYGKDWEAIQKHI